MRQAASERGRSLLEVLLVLSMSLTLGSLAIALSRSAIDEMRTAVAARYVAGRIGSKRIDAVRRASAVALRFEAVADDYMYAPYEDGNGNGVRTADIQASARLRPSRISFVSTLENLRRMPCRR